MTIRLWRGYHGPEIRELIQEAWRTEELLILCPPHLRDFHFLVGFPGAEIQLCGDWDPVSREKILQGNWGGESPAFVHRERPLYGVFTSGTTSGQPRLVLYTRANVLASLEAIGALFDEQRIRTIFCYPQPFHTFGLILGYLNALVRRVELVIPEGSYRTAFHQKRVECLEEKVLTLGAPTHFRDLIAYLETRALTLKSSYSCIVGGAPVTRELWRELRTKLNIQEPSVGYGCTEASPGITHLPPGVAPSEDHDIGFPLKSIESSLTSEGVVIRGSSLCSLMFQNDSIVAPDLVCIRDHIRVNEQGRWIFVRRLDLCLNRGGEKHSLESIQHSLFEELGVSAVCIAVADQRLGHDLGVLCKVAGNKNPNELSALIVRHVRQQFGFRMNPQRILFVTELPSTPNGKTDYLAARNLIQTKELA